MEKPKFIVKLRVVKATLSKTTDAYATVLTTKQTLRTKVISQNQNPDWNEEFSLEIMDPSELIRLEVYEKGRIFRDGLIGNALLDIGFFSHAIQMMGHNCVSNPDGLVKWSGGLIAQDVTIDLNNANNSKIFLQLRWDNHHND